LFSHSLQRQRCRHGNKSMHASLDLQTLQTVTSPTTELFLVSLDIRFNWTPPPAPLQQEAVSSTSLSPHPSRLSLLWCVYTWHSQALCYYQILSFTVQKLEDLISHQFIKIDAMSLNNYWYPRGCGTNSSRLMYIMLTFCCFLWPN
jgi:hypothetical protein